MSSAPLRSAVAVSALLSVCASPFLFGAVERTVWIPLSVLWMALGLAAHLLRPHESARANAGEILSQALLPLHALFAIQLLPLPGGALGFLSPGSFAAHFLPDPGDGRWRPLSVSPGATIEAWLYVAALQGLFLAMQGLSSVRRRTAIHAILGVAVVLGAEGLWQSRSEHPFLLYGRVPIEAPSGLDQSTFGPYFNRNHFATVTAMGCGLAAGLAASLGVQSGGLRGLLASSRALPRSIVLVGVSLFLALSTAASGSRSGTLAALGALAVAALRGFGKRFFLTVALSGVVGVVLAGPAAVERMTHLDLQASRWVPWLDMTTLFRFFPVFGSGIGTFGAAYWPYQRNAVYEFWQHAHNEYLEWGIEAGLVGIGVLFLVLQSVRREFRLADYGRLAGQCAVIAFMVQGTLDFPQRIPANGALLVCLMAATTERRPSRS